MTIVKDRRFWKKKKEAKQVVFVESKRGGKLLCMGRHKYRVQSKSGGGKRTRWVCSSHPLLRCKSVVHTYENTIIRIKNDHSH
ncbi:hypothetical protein EVAR_17891_1 [Eumeta japonica]|uniref:FLYWCH-type domain-containing protein n=1 Tax=Eumeta variegata TaxID=151549 RepID=A0A4C1UY30_EUMVA|nr:hypothetical protein EVAR_17891_1 [Eumeta japonica]